MKEYYMVNYRMRNGKLVSAHAGLTYDEAKRLMNDAPQFEYESVANKIMEGK